MENQQASVAFGTDEVQVALFLYIDENVHVCYAPELDLFGYGDTEDEALRSFTIVLDDYLIYGAGNQTLLSDLRRLGWQVDDQQHTYTPPALRDLLATNDDFSQTLQQRPFRKMDRLVAFAVAA